MSVKKPKKNLLNTITTQACNILRWDKSKNRWNSIRRLLTRTQNRESRILNQECIYTIEPQLFLEMNSQTWLFNVMKRHKSIQNNQNININVDLTRVFVCVELADCKIQSTILRRQLSSSHQKQRPTIILVYLYLKRKSMKKLSLVILRRLIFLKSVSILTTEVLHIFMLETLKKRKKILTQPFQRTQKM